MFCGKNVQNVFVNLLLYHRLYMNYGLAGILSFRALFKIKIGSISNLAGTMYVPGKDKVTEQRWRELKQSNTHICTYTLGSVWVFSQEQPAIASGREPDHDISVTTPPILSTGSVPIEHNHSVICHRSFLSSVWGNIGDLAQTIGWLDENLKMREQTVFIQLLALDFIHLFLHFPARDTNGSQLWITLCLLRALLPICTFMNPLEVFVKFGNPQNTSGLRGKQPRG